MARLFQLFILVTCISLLSTAHADCAGCNENDPSSIKEQLIKTNQCPGCTLVDADLSGANLSGTEFIDSNLMNATWINGKKCTDRSCSNLR